MSDVNAALLLLALRSQEPSSPPSQAMTDSGPPQPLQTQPPQALQPSQPPYGVASATGSPANSAEERKFRVYVPGEETFKLPVAKGAKRSFECHHCGRVFVRREHRQRHIETMHQGVKDFKCELCMRVFSRKDNMMQHVRNKHGKIRLLAASGKVNQQICLAAKPQVPAALQGDHPQAHAQVQAQAQAQAQAQVQAQAQAQAQVQSGHLSHPPPPAATPLAAPGPVTPPSASVPVVSPAHSGSTPSSSPPQHYQQQHHHQHHHQQPGSSPVLPHTSGQSTIPRGAPIGGSTEQRDFQGLTLPPIDPGAQHHRGSQLPGHLPTSLPLPPPPPPLPVQPLLSVPHGHPSAYRDYS